MIARFNQETWASTIQGDIGERLRRERLLSKIKRPRPGMLLAPISVHSVRILDVRGSRGSRGPVGILITNGVARCWGAIFVDEREVERSEEESNHKICLELCKLRTMWLVYMSTILLCPQDPLPLCRDKNVDRPRNQESRELRSCLLLAPRTDLDSKSQGRGKSLRFDERPVNTLGELVKELQFSQKLERTAKWYVTIVPLVNENHFNRRSKVPKRTNPPWNNLSRRR